jgi:hypothetical protein
VARRGDIVFALGNLCWKAYDQVSLSIRFAEDSYLILPSCQQIQAYSLFDGVFTTYSNYVKPSIQARLSAPATSKADRVSFYYWRGKMRLNKGNVRGVSMVVAPNEALEVFDAD